MSLAAPPAIIRLSPQSITVQGETDLVLFCEADAYPAPIYTWLLGVTFLLLTTQKMYATVRPVAGAYVCVATNALGNATSGNIHVSVYSLLLCCTLCSDLTDICCRRLLSWLRQHCAAGTELACCGWGSDGPV